MWRIEGSSGLQLLGLGGQPAPPIVKPIGQHTSGDPPAFDDPFDRAGDRMVVADANGLARWVGLDLGEGRWEVRAVGGHPPPPLPIVPEPWLLALGEEGAPDDPWLVVPAELTLAAESLRGTLRIERSGWTTLEGLPGLPPAWGWADPSDPLLALTLSGAASDVVLELGPDPWTSRFTPEESYEDRAHLREALADPCGARDRVAVRVTDAKGAVRGRIVYADGAASWEDPAGARFAHRGGVGDDSRIRLDFEGGTSVSIARTTPPRTRGIGVPDLGTELLRGIAGETPCQLGEDLEVTTCTARRVRHDPGPRTCAPGRQPAVTAPLDPATAVAVPGTVVAHGPATSRRFPWPRNPGLANRTQGQEGEVAFVPADGGAQVVLPVRAIRGMGVVGNGSPAILVSDAAGPAWLALAQPGGRPYAVHALGARPRPWVPFRTRESLLSSEPMPPLDGVVRLGREEVPLRLEFDGAEPRATLALGPPPGAITIDIIHAGVDGGMVLALRGARGGVRLTGQVDPPRARFHAEPAWFADRDALVRWLLDGCGEEPQLTFTLEDAAGAPLGELLYRARAWTLTANGRTQAASGVGRGPAGEQSELSLGFPDLGRVEVLLPRGWAARADWSEPPPKPIQRFDVEDHSRTQELDPGYALWMLAQEQPVSGVFAGRAITVRPTEWLDVSGCASR